MTQINMETLITAYEKFLNSLNVFKDSDDYLSLKISGLDSPIVIKERSLILPSQKLLKNGINDNIVVFHPLSENIQYGESEVLKKIKTLISVRLSFSIFSFMDVLVDILANQSIHDKLTPKASNVLSEIKDLDEKAIVVLKNVVKKLSDKNNFISIYLKRDGKLNSKTYSRVSVVSFPFAATLQNNEENKLLGINVRKKDLRIVDEFIKYIFPDLTSLEKYSFGSSCNIAPYFDSLIHSYYNVAKRLNEVVTLFQNVIDKAIFKDIKLDLTWIDDFDNLDVYKNIIPPLPFNEGERTNEIKGKEVNSATNYLNNTAIKKLNDQNNKIVKETLEKPISIVDAGAQTTPVLYRDEKSYNDNKSKTEIGSEKKISFSEAMSGSTNIQSNIFSNHNPFESSIGNEIKNLPPWVTPQFNNLNNLNNNLPWHTSNTSLFMNNDPFDKGI